MFTHLFPLNPESPVIREGDIYKIIDIHGHRFPLYYGYYEECDRENPAVDPMPIYPDFLASPRYTPEGHPFVTQMQDACLHYKGKETSDRGCAECEYYKHGDELLGICVCMQNRIQSPAEASDS